MPMRKQRMRESDERLLADDHRIINSDPGERNVVRVMSSVQQKSLCLLCKKVSVRPKLSRTWIAGIYWD